MGVKFYANPISWISILCFIILVLTFFSTPSLSAPKKQISTAYDVLRQNNLPRGLLPSGVKSFHYDNSTGKFTINLRKACVYSKSDFLKLKYNPSIKGVIAKNIITSLGGVKVKLLFVWVNIRQVSRNNGEIIFAAGTVPIPAPATLFTFIPSCPSE
ncbi:unnamed protein product [Lupinus luteus]|uniref:Uncharacterized protein n=1 Tax=Lupinus luteus TaxID=3873 RepID=A0AAV1WMX1_LUPLU